MREVKWPSFNEEKNTDVSQRDYFSFLQFSALLPKHETTILILILLCDNLENLYEALLYFSAQGIFYFENNLLKGVLNVSKPLLFSYPALKS